ncbi:MAG: 16S rRNA (guanine(966)-N(2))-methyltransferase RsmD [Alphaproteobacteria bacterium]|nr:16S rRNA (guanine(966)-N(2))-methyltransferase RsmD [Alphaproteobacteria bacterium]
MRIVGGELRGRRLLAPEGPDIRPTADRAREALFNILQHSLLLPAPLRGAAIVDAFAGTGAIACEALSRGAAHAILIDADRRALDCARANLAALGLTDRATVLQADATRLPAPTLSSPNRPPARLAYLDPPYRSGLAAPALASLADGGWLATGALVVVELAAREDFSTPERYALRDERRYGAARLVFLTLA